MMPKPMKPKMKMIMGKKPRSNEPQHPPADPVELLDNLRKITSQLSIAAQTLHSLIVATETVGIDRLPPYRERYDDIPF